MKRFLLLWPALLFGFAACSETDQKNRDTETASEPDAGTDGDTDTDTDIDTDTGEPAACLYPVGGDMYGTHFLRFESREDPSVRLYLERAYKEGGIGESVIYTLARMAVMLDDQCIEIEEAADLAYQNSHHNWMDKASGIEGGVRYELSMMYEFASAELRWACTLSIVDTETDSPIRAPLEMVPTGGPISATATAWSLPVIINEVMPNNTATLQDDDGEFEPWVELFNRDSASVDLSGWFLSNDATHREAWIIPDGIVLASHGYLIITADGETDEVGLHAGFTLSVDGGELLLTEPDGITGGERAYGPVSADESVVYEYAIDGLAPSTGPTPGAENPMN